MDCQINFILNKSQGANSYTNSDKINAFFTYSNISCIQTLSSEIIGSSVVSGIVTEI